MSSILQISDKPLKNIKEIKQGLVKICWEESHEKKAKLLVAV